MNFIQRHNKIIICLFKLIPKTVLSLQFQYNIDYYRYFHLLFTLVFVSVLFKIQGQL